jgi:hypothetical protein
MKKRKSPTRCGTTSNDSNDAGSVREPGNVVGGRFVQFTSSAIVSDEKSKCIRWRVNSGDLASCAFRLDVGPCEIRLANRK